MMTKADLACATQRWQSQVLLIIDSELVVLQELKNLQFG